MRGWIRRLQGRAQRLSASQRWAPCRSALRFAFRGVLNAFRHHRGGHDHELDGRRVLDRCSTPFGITEVGTCLAAARVALGLVLNAFRHHRGGHDPASQGQGLHFGVLNAFRHHRGGHRPFAVLIGHSSMCSTPFGITEVGTRGTAVALENEPVLNAFRHHRGGHTNRATSRRCKRCCAQRLSASQRWAHLAKSLCQCHPGVLNAFRHHRGGHRLERCLDDSASIVLNAFRHHRGGHTRPPSAFRELPECAQRLSASQRWARPRPITCIRPLNVLNAFRHHRGGHST